MSRDASMSILQKVVVDGFLIAGLTISMFACKLLWPPFQRGFFCNDETLMFPYHNDTVTVPMLRVVGLGVPLLAMLICEWALLRREHDDTRVLGVRIPMWVRGLYCAATSFALGVLFVELTTDIAKKTIGRPRPHFFEICRPSVDCSSPEWHSRYIQSSDYTCTGEHTERFQDIRVSFLSGHSSWSAFTMVFFALYLERRMTWRGTRVLRHTLQFTALMLSWFTALSRVSDFKHHWSDVLAGYFLGLSFAVIVWTWGTDLVQKKKHHSALSQHDVIVIGQVPDTA
ncbi:putative phosphatidate phosphatase [Choristoneura fumiferana]|uniref:putative phosphatidate phosphatase n=1 Tax=Choristoneura fumiferana TaxID=7141 RepID=UPI003D15E2D9